MEKLAPKIKELIDFEGYRVTLGPLEERTMKKTGISYKSIKITVKENEYSVPLPVGVVNLPIFEYKKTSDKILNRESENELL